MQQIGLIKFIFNATLKQESKNYIQ